MLPGMDGWEILKRIRKISNAPVIMLTAKGDTTDRVQGLDCGADDYVVKPFDSKELIARIRAVMRRSGQPEEIEKHIIIGSLDVDTNNRVVYVDGNRIELAPKEFDLLCYFIHNNGKVLTRGQLLDDVWGFEFYGDSRTVDVHVKRLRDNGAFCVVHVFFKDYAANRIRLTYKFGLDFFYIVLMFTSSVCVINLDRAIFGQFEPCGGAAIKSNALPHVQVRT